MTERRSSLTPPALALALGLLLAAPAAAQDKAVPYWASIAAKEAKLRTGPERNYPTTWVYRRRNLPLKVVQVEGAWRRVQEQDGTTGWMLGMLLSPRRSAVVVGGLRPIRDAPDDGARLLWQAAPGVVGRLAKCDGRWCHIQIGDRTGWIAQDAIWGTDAGERVP